VVLILGCLGDNLILLCLTAFLSRL
jgi:hypothetical protein